MGIMKIFCGGVLPVLLMFPLFTSVDSGFYAASESWVGSSESYNNAYLTRNYDRLEEVKKACEPVVDASSELEADDNRVYSIKHDLSFAGGDWEQEIGTHPLLPFVDSAGFNGSYTPRNPDASIHGSVFKLSGFRITDVDSARRAKKTVNINGALSLVITRHGPVPELSELGIDKPAQFQMWRGHSQVSIFFQGFYTESGENGGERVLCLLGNATLPLRRSDSANPWRPIEISDSVNYQPPLTRDNQILLFLRYPMKLTLTQRAIRGEMRSLNSKTDLKYFDKVHISSQLSASEYNFGSQAVYKACDNLPDGGIDVYKGYGFCSLFVRIQRYAMIVMPNWRCSGTDEFCSKLGPFATGKEIMGTLGGFKGVELLMQNVHCEEQRVKGHNTMANVSLVLRAVPALQNYYIERRRNGLGNMTLAAEGIWNSSKGELCMVGCLEGNACDSRVCFYIPTTFSIKQRSALVGTISSIKTKTPSYFPLSFQLPLENGWMMRQLNRNINFHYNYSKMGLARALLEKNERTSFGDVIKKSLLKFPRLQKNEDYSSSISLLAEDLTFSVSANTDPNPSSQFRTYVFMDILSVGSIFDPFSLWGNHSLTRVMTPYKEKAEYTLKQLVVNVSAQMSITGEAYSNFSSLSLEGLYDPVVGKMCSIGCRNVKESWKILHESHDLDGGFDCSTEVVISYPFITAQWLLNPTARISITSKRAEDDPLYFKPIKLKTLPIMYRKQREEILSERGIEGFLRVLTLSVVNICIASQLFYIRRVACSAPYMSLVMLGIQALGYGLPLVTDVETLFKKKQSGSYSTTSYELENGEFFRAIDLTVKLLVLIAFLLTLRLVQKVLKSRARLLTRANDKLVLAITLMLHIAGFIFALSVHPSKTIQTPETEITEVSSSQSSTILPSSSHPPKQMMVLMEEYTGFLQDAFLLPQVIGNLIWQINCKPLRKLYYVGLVIIRLLPHVYDYFRAPTTNPNFSNEYEFVNPVQDFYSKLSDILIPAITLLLAVIVYIQQRWSYEKLSSTLVLGRFRLLPAGSKVYQKLPSETFEAELASIERA